MELVEEDGGRRLSRGARIIRVENYGEFLHIPEPQQEVQQVQQVQLEGQEDQLHGPENLLCSFCDYTFHLDLPHFECKKAHAGHTSFAVCQACFYSWVHGEFRADNMGFRHRSCPCGERIKYNDVKSVLTLEQFEEYDNAMARYALAKDKNVLYCPGVDCRSAYFKPKKTKRPCRKATCNNCETEFCCQCGELYTKEHKRMKCGPYKKWKQSHDNDVISLNQWRESRDYVKSCPGCKSMVEKPGGCNEMQCTNCNFKFCWQCGKKRAANGRCEC